MRLNAATLWSCTLGITGVMWVLLPLSHPALAAVLALHAAVLAWGVGDLRVQFFGPARWRGNRSKASICLTFDDGPDPTLTADALRLLKEYGYHATFFVVARRARQYPALVREALAAGHTIACHDLAHHSATTNLRRRRRLLADIAEAQMVIGEIVGKKPLLYRPPVGLVNPHLHPALAHLGMTCIGWSRSAGDAGNRRTGALRTIGSLAGTGEVVLLHDVLPRPELREQLLANLRVLFDDIRKKELATETVDAFFEIPAYA